MRRGPCWQRRIANGGVTHQCVVNARSPVGVVDLARARDSWNSLGEPCRGRYVPAADAERFIAGWELTGDYLMSQPGYVDTALHQAVTPNADFQFVNIGRWQTAEDFLAATQSQGFREAAMGLTDFRPHPGLYRIVRT
jgi:heme-degrading monooxygenase HmoA